MDATCKTCPFWQPPNPGAEGSSGYCHHALSFLRSSDDVRVYPDAWCSEHPLRQRDRLAAMAMQGMLADPACTHPGNVAEVAYKFVDAMLSARSASPETPARDHNGSNEEGA